MAPIYSGEHKANSVEELVRLRLRDPPTTKKKKKLKVEGKVK